MNKLILKNKYKDLVSYKVEKFVEDLNKVKDILTSSKLDNRPLLIYSRDKQTPIAYSLCMYYSLLKDRILDYSIISGQSLMNQHFMHDKKDEGLYNSVYYSDITFITLSQFDYTVEFLESLIIDLIEFRNTSGKITAILYDVLDTNQSKYYSLTKKLNAYFISKNFNIIDIDDTSLKKVVKRLKKETDRQI